MLHNHKQNERTKYKVQKGGKFKVFCTFGLFLDRKTKQWKCQRLNEGHYSRKNKVFVNKEELLLSHMESCSPK